MATRPMLRSSLARYLSTNVSVSTLILIVLIQKVINVLNSGSFVVVPEGANAEVQVNLSTIKLPKYTFLFFTTASLSLTTNQQAWTP